MTVFGTGTGAVTATAAYTGCAASTSGYEECFAIRYGNNQTGMISQFR